MDILYFLLAFSLILSLLIIWSFKHLPDEKWQMLAVLPLRKDASNQWLGINITYYGFL